MLIFAIKVADLSIRAKNADFSGVLNLRPARSCRVLRK